MQAADGSEDGAPVGEPRVFANSAIDPIRDMALALEAVTEVLAERAAGTAAVPKRVSLGIGRPELTLTSGVLHHGQLAGLRAIPAAGSGRDQLTAVWSTATGTLKAIFVGPALGLLRTGAIGGVAIDRLCPPDEANVAVVGAGPHAFHQLIATRAVRRVGTVSLFRRDSERLRQAAAIWTELLGVPVRPAASARDCVEGASIVILATTSGTPVVDSSWIRQGAYVTTLGPKWQRRSELPRDLLDRAALVATDFIEQSADDPDLLTRGTRHEAGVVDLAAVKRQSEDRQAGNVVFLSQGLAGTEVAVAAKLTPHLIALDAGRPLTGDRA